MSYSANTAGDVDTETFSDLFLQRLKREANASIVQDPAMCGYLSTAILNQSNFEDVVAHCISERLCDAGFSYEVWRQLFNTAYENDPAIVEALRSDLIAVYDRDPVCDRFLEPVLFFKGFQAIEAYRMAHYHWWEGRKDMALYVQSRVSEVFQVDIHPQVQVGQGFFIDHGTGIVIGSTAVIGDNVSILQNVTLGGTGKETGDRHPKICDNVLIGAGANVLGNIEIGVCSKVAAGSVVLAPVPAKTTVAGVPARVVGPSTCAEPARTMNQLLDDKEFILSQQEDRSK